MLKVSPCQWKTVPGLPAKLPSHLAAERLAYQLPAEAVADHWHIPGDGVADQGTDGLDPRQRVIDAHRTAHETEAGKPVDRNRHRFASVDGDQTPGDPVLLEEYGKIARTFNGSVAKDGNR